MSDIECRFSVEEWFDLFTPEWYYENTLDIYLNGERITEVVSFDLCEGWVEHFSRGYRYMITHRDEISCEKSYGQVTLGIRRK